MDKTKFLWFAFLGSIGVYALVPLVVTPVSDEPEALVGFALLGVAALSALLSFIVPTLVARSAPDDRPEGFGLTLCLLRWVFAETIAIFGLVLFVLGHGAVYAFGLGAAAVVLMVVHAPGAGASPARSIEEMARPDVKIG